MSRTEPNFDHIARPYRWLEYLILGKALENCRNHYLPQLLHSGHACSHALVLGDGDGRFLAQLLKLAPHLHADAVDTSAPMLQLLRHRSEAATPSAASRLETHHTNALTFPLNKTYNLIVTHFFFDCLTQSELNTLVARIAPTLTPKALWLVSDFRIPNGPMHLTAKFIVRSLYLAFRTLTGLRTTRLPDHVTPLTQAGLTRISHKRSLAGILTTELWST